MKILVLIPWINYRGAETIAVNQCYWLRKAGHQVKIATIFFNKDKLPFSASGLDYILPSKAISSLCQKSQFFLIIFGPISLFILTLKNLKWADLIISHNPPSSWVAGLIAFFSSKTFVWIAHSLPNKYPIEKNNPWDYLTTLSFTGQIDKLAARQFNIIVAVSKKVQKLIREQYGKESAVLYPRIVKTGGTLKDLPAKVKTIRSQSDLLLLQVGNLHPQKQQEVTLGMAQKLIKRGIKSNVIFIGEGPDKTRLERISRRLGLTKNVYFAGYVSQKQLGAYYKIADLNIMPSVGESFSLTPLEALSHKTPSIISKDSGLMELISDYVISANSDSGDFERATLGYLENRGLFKKMAEKGSTFIRKKLSWQSFERDLMKIIGDHQSREVNPEIYGSEYFNVHYKNELPELRNEVETKLKRAINLLGVDREMKVLDLGCGDGELACILARAGCRVWGIDYSKEAIVLANQGKAKLPKSVSERIHFSLGNAKEMDFKNNFFDRVVSIDMFEHIYPSALDRVVYEIKRVSKNSGLVVIETSPNALLHKPVAFLAKKLLGFKSFENEAYHVNILNYFSLKKLLGKISNNIKIDLVNDGYNAFSSRMGKIKVPPYFLIFVKFFDFLRENKISEKIILSTPLKIFLAYDIWAVAGIKK